MIPDEKRRTGKKKTKEAERKQKGSRKEAERKQKGSRKEAERKQERKQKGRSPDVRSRERERVRVCTGCGAVSHAAVSCHVSVGLFFLACGALCGVASAEGHRLPALRARRPPVHTPHALPPSRCARAEEVRALCTILLLFREFASAECVSLSSRVTRRESSIRLTLPGESSIQLAPVKKGDPASGYTFGRSSIRLLPVLATNQWLALNQHNRLTSSLRKRNKSKNQRTREWCLSPSPSDHSLKVPTQVHHP